MRNFITYLLIASTIGILGCKKEKIEKVETLPEITQSGKNTFGAMVNGEVWVNRGRNSTLESNLQVIYDVDENGNQTVSVRATRLYRNEDPKLSFSEGIFFYNKRITGEGKYTLADPPIGSVHFTEEFCDYNWEEDIIRSGTLEITRLDLKEKIISGKFEFSISRPGCPTYTATDGRFDYKLN